ncbi:MAG: ABC transporter permease [Bacteroides sp.]|nr:ABC transporter permease [Eubacterium sp.]MCM1419216.1 ABC transporter permease [Roseburia sp.]MCM1463509.1 ABC transporter permease [Bacteroides sp.]
MSVIILKELKKYFSSKINILFLFLLPIIFVTFFSFALENYIAGDYETFEGGKIFYYTKNADAEHLEKFADISEEITFSTGVTFEETDDLEAARAGVEQSEAFAVIDITADGFDYFRSEFNEPVGGEIIRGMFLQLSDSYESLSDEVVIIENNMNIKKTTSKIYYTFAAAAFIILFMAFLTSMSIIEEKELGTDIRIGISSVSKGGVLFAKALTSICGGIAEIIIVYLYSSYVIGVEWDGNLPLIFTVLLLLVIFSTSVGIMIGTFCKSKAVAQDASLMVGLIFGYLGGSITPAYLMENMPVMNYIIKLSPLYWTNKALISLHNDIVDKNTAYSIAVLAVLSIVCVALTLKKNKEVRHA